LYVIYHLEQFVFRASQYTQASAFVSQQLRRRSAQA
jgi:hypothetical protein